MKKLAIIVSILCAFLLTALGIKSVSANDAPSYCVVVSSDFGIEDSDLLVDMLAHKVQGYMTDPNEAKEALKDVGSDGALSTEQAQALGHLLSVDYVVILHAYDNTFYDDILHNVDCGVDVVKTATGNEKSYMSNILVPKRTNPMEENRVALEQYLADFDDIVLE